jgi:hypothetical protein
MRKKDKSNSFCAFWQGMERQSHHAEGLEAFGKHQLPFHPVCLKN